jgi:hypothetical protein
MRIKEVITALELDHLHTNPVSGKWALDVHPMDDLHSSTGFDHAG